MDMMVSATPTSTATPNGLAVSANSTGGASTNGKSFMGALVQAINGGSETGTTTASVPAALSTTSLLAQFIQQPDEAQATDVLALLGKLLDQVQQFQQQDVATKEAEEALSALMAALQNLLGQLDPSATTERTALQSSFDTSQTSVITAEEQQSSAQGMQQLATHAIQLLQQLIVAVENQGSSIPMSAVQNGEMKAILDVLADQLTKVNAEASKTATNVKDHDAVRTAQANVKALIQQPVSTDAQNVVAVTTEVKRAAPLFRDVAWQMNVVDSSEADASEKTATTVTAVTSSSADQSAGADAKPAWTLMNNDQTLAAHQVAKPSQPAQVPVQQFAEQMDKQIVKQFLLTQGNGISEAKLLLTPEHLGQVEVRIVMQNGQMTAQFMTNNPMAKELLDNQMAQLRTSLQSQGLQVERLEVVQQTASTNTSFLHQDQRQQSFGGNRNETSGHNQDGMYEGLDEFESELDRSTYLRDIGYGSSLNVTA
ncbi:MAG: flagellar hook-length control protein FliK [Candidatus Cohnella colombiensis]|uniref:Flagellar hook-length control protein FliK n=1 Tax=Candidatus Cohnella colombiensis TaxID=3121368 RepID=A0AA95F1Y2_9BACL|nr:MAG: flagellar hook-length control protein FliK [Cohnella sp.]